MRYQQEEDGFQNSIFTVSDESLEKSKTSGEAQLPIKPNNANDTENRAQWGNGLEFLMSCIAMSVGLGNVWRFPFTAYENGGGAFLIPYIIVLLFVGRPMYYMEMALGQFTSRGNVKIFESVTPALKGVGFGQILGTTCVATYYCALISLMLFYLVNSFTSELPWSLCQSEWEEEMTLKNLTCVASSEKGVTEKGKNTISSSELWFTREVLKEKSQIEDGIGFPEWRLTICLLVSWVTAFLVSARGVKSSGKAAYFLALFPYVIMVALLIRAVTLEGASEGILYFIRPNWSKLASAKVWYAAVTQCFFSLNIGFGSIIMYASYNNFEHNINRDAMVVTTLDTFTSLLAGTTIFGILGNLAHELGVEVNDVINSGGTGLALISYPEAIAKFEKVPWVFAILFFVMLFVLGIGSLVALHGTINTAISDNYPNVKIWKISACTAILGFLIGLVYITPGGQFILTLVDYFGGTFIIFMLGVVESTTIMWWYGVENFCNDMEYMLKQKVGFYWRIMWGIVTPVILIIILMYFLATIPRLAYGPYEIADKALVCGWLIVLAAITFVAFFMVYTLWKNRSLGFPRMVHKSFSVIAWGPVNSTQRENWQNFKQQRKEDVMLKKESWFKHKLRFFAGR